MLKLYSCFLTKEIIFLFHKRDRLSTAIFKDFNALNVRQNGGGGVAAVISLRSSFRIFASFFAHLISCSFWLRISHAGMFKSIFESVPESTGKCQNLLCELESLLGDVFDVSFWSLLQMKLMDAGGCLLQRCQCCVSREAEWRTV